MILRVGWLVAIGAAMVTIASQAADSQSPAPLELVQTIRLVDVRGRIDHLAVDPDTARLFVAALGNDSVEVRGGRTDEGSSLCALP